MAELTVCTRAEACRLMGSGYALVGLGCAFVWLTPFVGPWSEATYTRRRAAEPHEGGARALPPWNEPVDRLRQTGFIVGAGQVKPRCLQLRLGNYLLGRTWQSHRVGTRIYSLCSFNYQ